MKSGGMFNAAGPIMWDVDIPLGLDAWGPSKSNAAVAAEFKRGNYWYDRLMAVC